MSERVEAIERLAMLLDEGKLSRPEYDELKAEILDLNAPPTSAPASPVAQPRVQVEEDVRGRRIAAAKHLGTLRGWSVFALVGASVYWAFEATVSFDSAFPEVRFNGEPGFFWGVGPYEELLIVEALYPLYFIATGILFAFWMQRAHENLDVLGRSGTNHSSNSAIWWWLVPVANLVMPHQVMYEVVRGTLAPKDDKAWESYTLPYWAWGWSAAFVGGLVTIAIGANWVGSAVTASSLQGGASMHLVGSLMLTAAAVFGAVLVSKVSDAQDLWLTGRKRGDSRDLLSGR